MSVATIRQPPWIVILFLVVAAVTSPATATDAERSADSLAAYLASWELDRSRWTPLDRADPWDAPRQ